MRIVAKFVDSQVSFLTRNPPNSLKINNTGIICMYVLDLV